jgi:Tfp pilus assembly protein PilV
MQRNKSRAIPGSGCRRLARDVKNQLSRIQQFVAKERSPAFALYEVLIGLTIFALGVLALGRAVENCLNASALSAEEDRVRQVLANRMAEIQATPGFPDAAKELKVDTGYGVVRLIQKSGPAELKEADGTQLDRINFVNLTTKWTQNGIEQSRQIEFYVYR